MGRTAARRPHYIHAVPRELRCPICGKLVPRRPDNRSFPFCSERCRLVDLGRWLGGEYRIPGAHSDGAAEPAAPSEDQEDER